MNLKALKTSNDQTRDLSQALLESGEPLVVRLDEILDHETIGATLLVDALSTKQGTRVTIKGAEGYTRKDNLANTIAGTDRSLPSQIGDVIAFSAAYARNGIAHVGSVSAREHDGLVGRAQVITAMARPSQSRVTSRGPSHSLTITDGSKARTVATVEEVIAELRKASEEKWPGGAAGLIIRDRSRGTIEYFLGKDRDEAYLADELRHSGALDEDRLEVIPAWRVSMGRDQMFREIDPRKETGLQSGAVTRMFEHPSLRGRQGFRPCMIVLADEQEWAFGGKTGKTHRVAAGVQPLPGPDPIGREWLSTAVRQAKGHRSIGIVKLHDEATMDRLAKARAGRRPPEPETNNSRQEEDDYHSDRSNKAMKGFVMVRR